MEKEGKERLMVLTGFGFHKESWLAIQYLCSSKVWEKAMATHFSTLAWKIPWTEKPGRLQFMGSLGVGHD